MTGKKRPKFTSELLRMLKEKANSELPEKEEDKFRQMYNKFKKLF